MRKLPHAIFGMFKRQRPFDGSRFFAAARIMYAEELGKSGESVYGVAYVPAGQAWTGR